MLMPQNNGEDPYTAQFGAFHTPDASPNASPDPDATTKEFKGSSFNLSFTFSKIIEEDQGRTIRNCTHKSWSGDKGLMCNQTATATGSFLTKKQYNRYSVRSIFADALMHSIVLFSIHSA